MPNQLHITYDYLLDPYAFPILLIILAIPVLAFLLLRKVQFSPLRTVGCLSASALTLWLIFHLLVHSTIDETVALMREAIGQEVRMNVIINNRSGGNAPLIAKLLAERFAETESEGDEN